MFIARNLDLPALVADITYYIDHRHSLARDKPELPIIIRGHLMGSPFYMDNGPRQRVARLLVAHPANQRDILRRPLRAALRRARHLPRNPLRLRPAARYKQ